MDWIKPYSNLTLWFGGVFVGDHIHKDLQVYRPYFKFIFTSDDTIRLALKYQHQHIMHFNGEICTVCNGDVT